MVYLTIGTQFRKKAHHFQHSKTAKPVLSAQPGRKCRVVQGTAKAGAQWVLEVLPPTMESREAAVTSEGCRETEAANPAPDFSPFRMEENKFSG